MTDDKEYFESKGFQKILKEYEKSAKSGQATYMDADDLADIADYYQLNGRTVEAETAINLAFEYNPEAVGPLLYRAHEALNQKDYDTTQSYINRLEVVDSLEALFLKGELMICQKKTDEADDLFREKYKDIMPDEQLDYVYDVASLFADYEIYEKSFEWMARSQGDDSDDFKELMGRILCGLGKYQDSERIFNELIDHNPYSSAYWNALATVQFMNEDYNAAITSSEYAIAINPKDADSISSKAHGLFNLGNYESALLAFKKYTELMPHDDFSYLHQGTCLINLGRYEEAIAVLEKAEQESDENSIHLPGIYQELAYAYSELKNIDTALYYIDKTKDYDCDHINMEIIRGHILLSNGLKKEAEETFTYALQHTQDVSKTMLRIIVSLYDNHYIQSCYHLMKNFFKVVDDNWDEGYSYMANCCLNMKKQDEFLYYLKLAVERNPKEAREVLKGLFPEGMRPDEYYDYMLNKINNQ